MEIQFEVGKRYFAVYTYNSSGIKYPTLFEVVRRTESSVWFAPVLDGNVDAERAKCGKAYHGHFGTVKKEYAYYSLLNGYTIYADNFVEAV